MPDWSPTQYLKFEDERTRPARELLARVSVAAPKLIYDLGCGPGNSTALLADAFPGAEIVGIDNSEEMLAKARISVPGARFEHGDLNSWQPDRTPDLIFSNATFQWLPHHLDVMKAMIGVLARGGVFAVQMPDNLNEPSHAAMNRVAADARWSGKLKDAAAARTAVLAPQVYYNALRPLCASIDIWHTIYNHPLDGATGIVEWVKSTGLRPFLTPLDADEQRSFLAAYQSEIAKSYPVSADGKSLLRFPRLFLVAVR